MKIVFLDAATLGETPLDEIAALGELVAWPSSTREQALLRLVHQVAENICGTVLEIV